MVQNESFEAIRELYAKHHQRRTSILIFEADLPEAINSSHHLMAVATGIDLSTEQSHAGNCTTLAAPPSPESLAAAAG